MWSSRLLGLAIGFGAIQSAGTLPVSDWMGIGTARASEFYSRRRVNGVWETGQFAKAEVDGELRRRGVGARPEPRIRRGSWSRNVARPRRVGWARARFQSLGGQATASTGAPLAAAVAAAPIVPLAAVAILPEPGIRPAVPLVVEPEATAPDTRREYLRRGLEAKAQELAAALAGDAPAPPATHSAADASPADLQPLSSTYDYRTNVRTTVYGNGAIVQETLAGPAGPPIATRRFVGVESPRPTGDGLATAR